MSRRRVPFNRSGIDRLPDDRPVVYRIQTEGGRNNYTGTAMRGRVQERLREHLPSGKDPIPGASVEIEQTRTIQEARRRESEVISRSRPPHNERGK